MRSVDVLLSLRISLCEICQFVKYATLTLLKVGHFLEVQELHDVVQFLLPVM